MLQITLTAEVEGTIREQLEGGLYPAADAVVADALRLLKERQKEGALPVSPKYLSPRTLADSIGACADEPLWDDLMAQIEARRRVENALEP